MNDFDITILHQYLDGKASRQQQKDILDWLEKSEENKRFFADYSANYYLHDTVTAPDFERGRERMIQRLSNRIDNDRIERRRFSFASAAAGFCSCVAIAAVVAIVFILPSKTQEAVIEPLKYCYANSTTDTKSLILADGTKMFLKPGSEIEYDVTGNSGKRIVRLRGEAFFDVAKDSLRPMFVETDILSVKVVGTAFSVRSKSQKNPAEVILERGCVVLMDSKGSPKVRMSPNQKASLDEENNVIKIENVSATPYVIENFNLESLENATIGQILRRLERVYGVNLSCNPRKPDNKYYFSFLRTDTIIETLSVVRQLTGEECRITTTKQ